MKKKIRKPRTLRNKIGHPVAWITDIGLISIGGNQMSLDTTKKLIKYLLKVEKYLKQENSTY